MYIVNLKAVKNAPTEKCQKHKYSEQLPTQMTALLLLFNIICSKAYFLLRGKPLEVGIIIVMRELYVARWWPEVNAYMGWKCHLSYRAAPLHNIKK